MHAELCGPSSQVMALGIVPMCSYQMERMFNTTRIPGKETGTQNSRTRVGSPDQPLPPSCGPAGLCGLLPVRHEVSSVSQGCVTGKNSRCLSNVRHLLFIGEMPVLGPGPSSQAHRGTGVLSTERRGRCCCLCRGRQACGNLARATARVSDTGTVCVISQSSGPLL